MTLRKLPIGIQDFPSLREDGYLYVDKTDLVHKLVNEGRFYFLSRPRRFGKSLLCSALGACLEGRKELFAGLALERLEQKWTKHPVLRLDLNAERYDSVEGLDRILENHLVRWEAQYGAPFDSGIPGRLRGVIERAHQATGQRVAVIVDDCEGMDAGAANAQRADPEGGSQDVGREYDKPLLQTLDKPALNQQMKERLKPFFGVFKSVDAHLKFLLLTGVTKFGQVSVFSDLNQLADLSLHPAYVTLCGITEQELVDNFAPELDALAKAQSQTPQDALAEVRRMYNGYRLEENALGVYNPFSKLNLLATLKFLLMRLKSFFAGIPYDLNDQTERHCRVVVYLVFTLLGRFVQSEVKSALGRSDAVVETSDSVFVFEFKLNGTAEEAMEQIDAKGYPLPYLVTGKKTVKLAVEFDKAARNLGRWLIA